MMFSIQRMSALIFAIFVILALAASATSAQQSTDRLPVVRSSPSSPHGPTLAPRPPEKVVETNRGAGKTAAAIKMDAILNVDSELFFATLQDAIANAAPGDTLEVQAAFHDEGRVSIDRDLTLRGATGTETIRMTENTGSVGDDRAWFLVAPGVDLHVHDLGFDGHGFLVYQAFRHQGTGSFASCRFHDIEFHAAGPEFAGTAIAAFGGNVDVSDSTFSEIGRVGVLAFGSGVDGAVIEGNTYTGKGDGAFLDYAFEVGGGAATIIWNNTVSDCRGIAPDTSQSGAILVTTSFGAGTSAVVSENTLIDNQNGIFVGFSSATLDSSLVSASFNRITGNARGVVNFSSTPLTAENNWWGCNGGPGAAGCDSVDDSGAPVGGMTDADPRLVLAASADPPAVIVNGSATVTADLTRNSDGADTSSLGHLPDGTAVLFSSPALGDIAPGLAATTLGQATSIYTAPATPGTDLLDVQVDNEIVTLALTVASAPELLIDEGIAAGAGEAVNVPVQFHSNGASIAAIAFSVDFDQTCLAFDPTDADLDGLPDAITLPLPASYFATVFVDLGDTDGEIDILIAEIPPLNPLADGIVANITFTTLCTPPAGSTILAPVGFSDDPTANFGGLLGQDVPGTAVGGSVEILSGLRGDCNGDGFLSAGDISACGLELFDGDDNDNWLDVPNGTFAGIPVGCDANADTVIDAGDVSCKTRLVFGLSCDAPAPAPITTAQAPELRLPHEISLSSPATVTLPISIETAGQALNSLVFSLDYNEEIFAFDPSDADGDGLPDAVRPLAALRTVSVSFAAADKDGEIDLLLTDVSTSPRQLADGLVLEIEFQHLGTAPPAAGSVVFSQQPRASFGHVSGASIAGTTRIVVAPLFTDGFESGSVSAWSD